MKVSYRVLWVCGAWSLATLAAMPAFAGHGKAGLWTVTVTNNTNGMQMPDLSKLPPEAQAAMRAHGVSVNGHTMTVQHCMTQEEVNADHPTMRNEKECKLAGTKVAGNTFSADMTCHGEMQGTGHAEFVFDSPEHYMGRITMVGSAGGHPFNNATAMEGRWISADCKGLAH